MQRLMNNKAAGEDNILADIFKACPETMPTWIHRIITKIRETETIPQDWSDAVLLPFFKKVDKRVCSNYRGIRLIDVAAKIFTIVLLRRFQGDHDLRAQPNQSGFRPGRVCTDQIFVLQRILEERCCYQQPTIICFVDFAAAFAFIVHNMLWEIMRRDGMPVKLPNLLRAYYRHTRASVRCYGNATNLFDI